MVWILGYLGVDHECFQLVGKPRRKDISLKCRQVAGCLICLIISKAEVMALRDGNCIIE